MHMPKKWLVIGLAWVILTAAGVVWLQATPSIGSVAATPAYIVVNTDAPVLFTAQIPDQSLVLNGAKVVRLDPSGKGGTSLGVMHDDGKNGDTVRGDRLFGLRATLNRPTIGQESYRVFASFSGVSQVVQSAAITIYIDPFPLPPDPGEAGKQTLQGIDSDDNGMRDDVQRYIALTFRSPADLNAVSQYSSAVQQAILEPVPAADDSFSQLLAGTWCLSAVLGPRFAYEHISQLLPVLLNTAERRRAYFRTQEQFDDVTSPSPGPEHLAEYCRF